MLTLLKKMLPFDLGGPGDPLAGTSVVDVVEAAEPALRDAMRDLVEHLHYEIVPMASIDEAIEALPPGSRVSVT